MNATDRDMIPVVSYARISADLDRDEHGVLHQHATNRQTADRLGYTVIHEFTDNDKSAAKVGVVRDEFEAMLRALRAGKLADGRTVQGVIVIADDRLARRPGDYERFVEAITFRDGQIYADQRGTKDLYNEDVESIVGLRVSEHARRMLWTCFTLANMPAYRDLRLGPWAHMLGYPGHFSSKSRRYSVP